MDRDGLVNEWNSKTTELAGFTSEEAMGKPLVETFIQPHLREEVGSIVEKALRGQETANYELRLLKKDGGEIMLLINSTSRRDQDDVIVGVVGVAQDITEK